MSKTFKARHSSTGEVVEFRYRKTAFDDLYINQSSGEIFHELGFYTLYERIEPEEITIPTFREEDGSITTSTIVLSKGGAGGIEPTVTSGYMDARTPEEKANEPASVLTVTEPTLEEMIQKWEKRRAQFLDGEILDAIKGVELTSFEGEVFKNGVAGKFALSNEIRTEQAFNELLTTIKAEVEGLRKDEVKWKKAKYDVKSVDAVCYNRAIDDILTILNKYKI